jgi:DNA invertase Pin-like site-specific DNA recombinase
MQVTAPAPATTLAREYLRVSLDRSGHARSIEQQHDENARAATVNGWTLAEPYSDHAVSASRYSRKARGGFADLMADLDAGRFGANILILWESSRGSRRVGEWVDLVEVCAEQHVSIFVTTHGRSYDPANPRDRRSLLEDAVDSEYESSKISERTKRDNAARAAAGRPHGRTPYGFRRAYDPGTGALLGQEEHPDEARVVRELFARILAGHSLRGIARDFERRGIRSRSGGLFSPAALRSLAVRDSYRGFRVHDPGRTSGTSHSVQALTTPATWPGLVSEGEFHGVRRILGDPSRRTNRPGRGVHLLSMIARCDVCGGPLAATDRDGRGPQYQCHTGGHVRVSKAEVDAVAEQVMLAYLSTSEVYADFTRGDADGPELQAVRAEVAELRARLDELADAVADGSVSITLAARSEPRLRERLAAAERRERELATPSALLGLIEPGPDVTKRWQAAPMSARREVARLLLAPDVLGQLHVTRSPTPGRPVPAAERIVFRREDTDDDE